MRRPLRLFQGYPSFTPERAASPMKSLETSITEEFTPAQTLALLQLRRSELSLAVLAKLEHGTARAGSHAKAELMAKHLVTLPFHGRHQLTPYGHFKANALARALAEQLGIPLPQPAQALRRGGFRPGNLLTKRERVTRRLARTIVSKATRRRGTA